MNFYYWTVFIGASCMFTNNSGAYPTYHPKLVARIRTIIICSDDQATSDIHLVGF